MGDQLIVAGFHRSGTSLVGQILNRAGLFLGYEMLGAHRTNPHGHFEDREVVSLHDDILVDNGLTWQVSDQPFPAVGDSHRERMQDFIDRRESDHEAWGFKDPRACLFVDQWKELLPGVRVLIVYRNFAEATRSLHRRHGGSLARGVGRTEYHRRFWEERDLALRMWLVHNKALLDFARAHPEDVLAVSFDMLQQGFPLIRTLNQRWGLSLECVETSDVFDSGVAGEGDKQPVADRSLIRETLQTWEALELLGSETKELAGEHVSLDLRTEDAFHGVDDLYDSLMQNEYLLCEVAYLKERVDHFRESMQEKERERRKTQAQLENVLGRLREAQRELREARTELQEGQNLLSSQERRKELERTEAELQDARKLVVPRQRRKELEGAEKDLRLVVLRASRSRLAPLFRLKKEFRELEQRYGV